MEMSDKILKDVKLLYREVTGREAPEMKDGGMISPLPPWLNPLDLVFWEANLLKRMMDSSHDYTQPVPRSWSPPVELLEGEDRFTINVEVPGCSRDSVELYLAGNNLVVRGEREYQGESPKFLHSECPYGPFERVLPLPVGSEQDSIEAKYDNGILRISLMKAGRDRKTGG